MNLLNIISFAMNWSIKECNKTCHRICFLACYIITNHRTHASLQHLVNVSKFEWKDCYKLKFGGLFCVTRPNVRHENVKFILKKMG